MDTIIQLIVSALLAASIVTIATGVKSTIDWLSDDPDREGGGL